MVTKLAIDRPTHNVIRYIDAVEGFLRPNQFSQAWHHAVYDAWQAGCELPMNQAARFALGYMPSRHAYFQSHLLKSLVHCCDESKETTLALVNEGDENHLNLWQNICRCFLKSKCKKEITGISEKYFYLYLGNRDNSHFGFQIHFCKSLALLKSF